MDKLKNNIKYLTVMAFTVLGGGLLLFRRQYIGESISEGLEICGDILVPSLFPFMVLSGFALNSGAFSKAEKLFSPLMNRFFKLPERCFTVIFFGFTGGYPVGGRMIGELYEKGEINGREAKRLFSFCVNGGPAFIVTAAGGAMLGSEKTGWIMLGAVTLASLITGIAGGVFDKEKPRSLKEFKSSPLNISDALVLSVQSGAGGMISVCAWVLVFSAVSGAVEPFINSETFNLIFDALSEVTSGIPSAAKLGGAPFTAACISFGGICVGCQLLPSIKKCGIKVREYLFFRILNSALSYGLCFVFMRISGVSISVSAHQEAHLLSSSAPASAALLIMCGAFILETLSLKENQTAYRDISG